ncbi:family 20 glycosylhydrolase [Bacteroides sp.]
MKILIYRYLFILALFGMCGVLHLYGQNPKPFVVPELREWKGDKGEFTPSERTRIVCSTKQPELLRIASLFSREYKLMFGKELAVVSGTFSEGDIVFCIRADKRMPKEGYNIDIKRKVVVSASEPIGVYWATRSLLQMSEQSASRSLPYGKIKDYPDYAVRGFMLDCGRKFIPLEFLRDYVKIMSYYKMNTFQIHLNDNAFPRFYGWDLMKTYSAFRLQSDTYPGLTAQDGSYSKQEFIDLQKLAENHFVDIIPEIDVPAHSLAFTQYKPEIGSREYGMDHLDLFKPETYSFVEGLFKEYLEGDEPVFRGKRVHIGTDEYSNKHKAVVEKFRYFTDHFIKYVEGFGKQACIWGALTHAKGETPVKSENVVMHAWYNGYADPVAMIRQGYQLVSVPDGLLYIVPGARYYHDYLNTKQLYETWTPAHIGKVVLREKHPSVLGGMFAVWNDHAGNGISTKDIHDRTLPAVQTLSAKMWTGTSVTLPYVAFDNKRKELSEAPGVNQAGRIGRKAGLVYEQAVVKPNEGTPHREVGYNYTVTFDIDGTVEAKGTELFRSPSAVFYLSDPITGLMGFARDGYLNTIHYSVKNEKVRVKVEGDSKSTRFYINDKLVGNMDIARKYFNAGKDSMNYVRTLVFPLERSGDFKSKISNLKVFSN